MKPSLQNFLDKVDEVLNSNTFFLQLPILLPYDLPQIQASLKTYIQSGALRDQILEQDRLRDWNNYEDLRGRGGIKLHKTNFELSAQQVDKHKRCAYLRNMLTVEQPNMLFFSPYKKQLTHEVATEIVRNLVNDLFPYQEWILITFDTNFAYKRIDRQQNSLPYFEGGFSSDSMTLLLSEKGQGYILLTNGIA